MKTSTIFISIVAPKRRNHTGGIEITNHIFGNICGKLASPCSYSPESIAKSGLTDAEVYFQITRKVARRNHLFPVVFSSFMMTVKPSRIMPKNYIVME